VAERKRPRLASAAKSLSGFEKKSQMVSAVLLDMNPGQNMVQRMRDTIETDGDRD
jgi:hypothetical protein